MDAFVGQLIAGSVSGICADLVTHPLSTVKTRLQCQGATAGLSGQASVLYTGPISGMRHMIRNEGALSLYKGVGVVVAVAAPAQAMYFAGYELARSLLGKSGSSTFIAGVCAQLSASICWVPMDVIKERLQIEGQLKTGETYGSSWSAVKRIVKTEGFRGMYRAYGIHQFVWAPFNGIYFTCYESAKLYVKNNISKSDVAANAAASLFAGITASAITSPLDLVKTRMQVMQSNPKMFPYNNSWDCFKQVLQKEGVRALWDGVDARIIWLTPRLSIAMVTYEWVKYALASRYN